MGVTARYMQWKIEEEENFYFKYYTYKIPNLREESPFHF